jgi:hypothetical protein
MMIEFVAKLRKSCRCFFRRKGINIVIFADYFNNDEQGREPVIGYQDSGRPKKAQ